MNYCREKSKDFMIILIIVMIGVLIRIPVGNLSSVDVSKLHDPDSFLYARRAIEFYNAPINEWSLFTDRIDDPLMNTVYVDNVKITTNFISICVAFICKLFKHISIDNAVFFFSAVFCPLSAVPTYLFIKRHSNTVGAIVGALLMALAPAYYMHTMAGYFDTDSIIMVMALLVVLSQIELFFSNKRLKSVFCCITCWVSLCILYFAWEIYYMYALLAIGITIVIIALNKRSNLELNVVAPCVSMFAMVVFCILASGKSILTSIISLVNSFGENSPWPNESKYVAELAKTVVAKGGPNNSFLITVPGLVNWLGGIPFVIVAVGLITYFLFARKSNHKIIEDKKNQIVLFSLLLWTLVTLPISFLGIRFVQLVELPLVIIVGLGVGYLFENINEFSIPKWEVQILILIDVILLFGSIMISNYYVGIIVSVVLLVICISKENTSLKDALILLVATVVLCPIVNEYKTSNVNMPYVSVNTELAAEYIDKNASNDSAIVSWWGYGYYYQYFTGIHTVSDGGIYDGAYFYWLANAFTTEDERLSVAICKMLQGGSIEAVNLAQQYMGDAKVATKLLKEILVLDKNSALNCLVSKYGLSVKEASKLVEHSHPNNCGDIYVVFGEDIKEFSGIIAYYGLWDFDSEKTYETTIEKVDGKTIYKHPKELDKSIMVKVENGDSLNYMEKVYSNDTVDIIKIGKDVGWD